MTTTEEKAMQRAWCEYRGIEYVEGYVTPLPSDNFKNGYMLGRRDALAPSIASEAPPPLSSYYGAAEEEQPNVRRFRAIVNQMADTYRRKNADYGNSFSNTIAKYGVGTALARIDDKLSSATNLLHHGNRQVKDEAVADTLLDLATYSIMLLMEIESQN